MLSSLRIICVDDDENDREIFKVILNKIIPFAQIKFLNNGEDFVNYIFKEGRYKGRNSTKGYHIVFLDMKMPKMNGTEVLKRLRKAFEEDKLPKSLPVVMLSTSHREQDISESKRLGALDYIIKPFSYQEMIKTFSQAFAKYIRIGAIQETEI